MKTYCFNEQTSTFEASYSSHVLDVKAILSSLCCTCSTKRFPGYFYPPPHPTKCRQALYCILRFWESRRFQATPRWQTKQKYKNDAWTRAGWIVYCFVCFATPQTYFSYLSVKSPSQFYFKKIKKRSKRDGCDHPPLALYFHPHHPHWRDSVSETFVYTPWTAI